VAVFVIDEDMHRSVSEVLTHLGHGHTAIDIRDMEMRGESDEAIFRFAQKHKAALLSGDIGFARNVRFAKSEHYGIVVVRFPNCSEVSRSARSLRTFAPQPLAEHVRKDRCQCGTRDSSRRRPAV